MNEAEIVYDISEVCSALGQPIRLKIMRRLVAHGYDITVSDLAEEVGESVSNTSAHLQKLRTADLIMKARQRGTSSKFQQGSAFQRWAWIEKIVRENGDGHE